MPVLKSTLFAMLLLLAGNVLAVEAPRLERRTWRVQPRGSQSQSLENLRIKTQTSSRAVVSASDVEVLPTAEPPAGVYDPELPPRLQFVERQSIGTAHQVRYAEPVSDPSMFYDGDTACCDTECCDGVGCNGFGCDGVGCGRSSCRPMYWGRVDYLHWWLEGANAPALVTTSSAGTSRNDAGILGLSSTTVLFGGDELGDQDRSGGRVEFGQWFEARGGLGWHVAYFGLEDSNDRGRFFSNSIPILARPFFSVEPIAVGPNAELIAFPGEVEGNIAVDHQTSFDGAEFMFRWVLADRHQQSLQLVAGYQYNGLDDDLAINDFRRVIGGSSGFAVGTTLVENDQFQAENQFHGAALGVLASARNCRTTLDLGMRFALGNTNSKVRINGSTTSSVPVVGGPNDVATTVGGLLALPSNIGFYENNEFAVVPQVDLAIGYDIRPHVRAILGYRFMYWSQVARAAEQIDPEINLSQLDPGGVNGEARPRFDFRMTDLWAQGISAGLDYRF